MSLETLVKSSRINLIAAAVVVAVSAFALAQWWSPFGPSTYEDCILQGTRGMTSDDGVALVRSACESKFNNKDTSGNPFSDALTFAKTSLLKSCNIPDDATSHSAFSVSMLPKLQEAANKIEKRKIDGFIEQEFSFQNKNKFSISSVALGFTSKDGGNCPTETSDYDAVFICTGFVGSGTYGTMQCPKKMYEFSNDHSFCVAALQPGDVMEAKSRTEIASIFEKLGLCD